MTDRCGYCPPNGCAVCDPYTCATPDDVVVDLAAERRRRQAWQLTDRRTPPPALTARRIAAAFDVPLYELDDDRLRAELALRQLEADRWADDGGPCPPDPTPPLTVTVRPDVAAFGRALAEAMRPVFDVFRRLAEAVVAAARQFGAAFGRALGLPGDNPRHRRWPHDTAPNRWRDWLPATEPKIDRARREHLERQLRTRARRAARRQRIRTRKAAGWRQIARAGAGGAAALELLRDAAAAARAEQTRQILATERLTLAVRRPAGLILPGGIA